MANPKGSVLARVGQQAAAGALEDAVTLTYLADGGVPGRRLTRSLVMTASGRTRVKLMDENASRHAVAQDSVARDVPLELCRLLSAGAERLTPVSQARFEPDSLVGMVTIGLGDEAILAENHFIDIPPRLITKENLDEFISVCAHGIYPYAVFPLPETPPQSAN